MGITDFYKIFESSGEISLNDIGKRKVFIDAMNELYRMILGHGSTRGLTDAEGKTTIHIKGTLDMVLDIFRQGLTQIWVFDSKNVSVTKAPELKLRRERREAALEKLEKHKYAAPVKKKVISDDEDDDEFLDKSMEEVDKKRVATVEIDKLEKRAFVMEDWMIADVQYMLDCMGIAWTTAPDGIEAEAVAAFLARRNKGVVLSRDADALVYGAPYLLKKLKGVKKYELYDLNALLKEHDITLEDMAKIAIILGCDSFKKKKEYFAGIGPKTVVASLKKSEVQEKFKIPEIKEALSHYSLNIPPEKIKIQGQGIVPLENTERINEMINWMVRHGFKKDLLVKKFSK